MPRAKGKRPSADQTPEQRRKRQELERRRYAEKKASGELDQKKRKALAAKHLQLTGEWVPAEEFVLIPAPNAIRRDRNELAHLLAERIWGILEPGVGITAFQAYMRLDQSMHPFTWTGAQFQQRVEEALLELSRAGLAQAFMDSVTNELFYSRLGEQEKTSMFGPQQSYLGPAAFAAMLDRDAPLAADFPLLPKLIPGG